MRSDRAVSYRSSSFIGRQPRINCLTSPAVYWTKQYNFMVGSLVFDSIKFSKGHMKSEYSVGSPEKTGTSGCGRVNAKVCCCCCFSNSCICLFCCCCSLWVSNISLTFFSLTLRWCLIDVTLIVASRSERGTHLLPCHSQSINQSINFICPRIYSVALKC